MQKYKNPTALLGSLRSGEKFLFVVVILFIFGLASQFLGALLASLVYDFSVKEVLTLGAFDDPQYVAAAKLIQIVSAIGIFIVPAFLFSFLFDGSWCSYYRSGYAHDMLSLLLTVFMMVAVIPLVNYLAEINMRMTLPFESLDSFLRNLEGEAEKIIRAFTGTGTFKGLLVNLFMIGVLAAVGEELIFRGLLQRLLTGMVKNPHLAILITAVLFSAFHFQFYSFLPRFVLGLILGYLMFLGKSLWYPILAHFVNNIMGVVYYHFNAKGSADDMLEEIGTSTMLPIAALVSLLLFVLFFMAWYYRTGRVSSLSHPIGGTGTR